MTQKIGYLIGLVVTLLALFPTTGSCEELSLTEFMHALSAEREIEIRLQQIVDLRNFNNTATGKMLYEPTDEVYENYTQIKSAIPRKTAELVNLLVKKYGAEGAQKITLN